MNITGLQKMTLLDFPGRIACTVFLQGCNFRCPFCHNSDLLDGEGAQQISVEELLTFLKKRKGMLDGVCITGGEPTVQRDLPELLAQIKALGYPVKLDTNGSNPAMLRALVAGGLVDYVAMDIKNSRERYGETAGVPGLAMEKIEESIRFLLEGNVNYELRTTVVRELHRENDILAMGNWLANLCPGKVPGKLFLQYYVDRESVLCAGFTPPDAEQMAHFREILAPFCGSVSIRGEE